jgi:uncharacterized protein
MLVAALIGIGGGVLSGLFGVGGGILFVPALVLAAHLSQIDAEATSLVAIIPVALVGAWRQRRYGNVRLGDGVGVGALAAAGAAGGVALANVLSTRALELGFAALTYVVAVQMARRAWRGEPDRDDGGATGERGAPGSDGDQGTRR